MNTTMAKKFGIIQAPDGFYIGSILKTGMLSADARKITEQEIIAMFEDVLRRNKAETGKDVMTIFSKRVPVLMAKLNPDIRETGILPRPNLTPEQIQILRQRQMMRQAQMAQQARKAKQFPLKVGDFGGPQN